MKKPIIGIVVDFISGIHESYNYSLFPWYALRQNYALSIAKAGGVPILIPYNHDLIEDTLDLIDGLLITGSHSDVDPELYGQQITSDRVILNKERTDFEMELMKQSLKRDIPFFGICNGMQLLNVLHGGSLFQHLPDVIDQGISHVQPHPKNIPSHPIHINPGTLLSTLTTSDTAMVNSTHHQGVDRVGNNLIISATAPDGVVEAIELTGAKFAIGIEWHPEYLETELDFNLFKTFIKECSV